MDGASPPPTTGLKSLDAAFAHFASDEHQAVLRRLERYRKPVPVGPTPFIDIGMSRAYGTYWGKP